MAKQKKSNRTLYILLTLVGVLVLFAIIGKAAGWIGKAPETSVEVARVEKKSIVEVVAASGMVQPVTEVKISPEVPGEIIELLIEEGDSVQVGQLLVKIKPDNFVSALDRSMASLNQSRANLAQAKATLEKAEAQLRLSELEFNRQDRLHKENVIPDSEFQTAQASFQVAKNEHEAARQNVAAAQYVVESAEATVKEARENLSFTSIRAPQSGIVSKLNVEKGEIVVGTGQYQGTEMLRIADLSNMEVRVDVNENDIIRVSVGDTATIEVDSYTFLSKQFEGVVTQIANTANDKASPDAVTEFEVRIKILNESYEDLLTEGNKTPFRPGMTASVEIITRKKDETLAAPLSAVTMRTVGDTTQTGNQEERTAEEQAEKEVVFVNDNGVAKMVQVETGISDFNNIEILKGLEEGQEVISGPYNVVAKLLKDGDVIKPNK